MSLRIRGWTVWIIACLLWPLAGTPARAADSLVFSPTSSSIAPGQQFTLSVTLNTTHPVYGFSMYLQSSAPNTFTLIGETVAPGGSFTDSNYTGAFPVTLPASGNSPDFGYTSSGTTDLPAGTYPVGTLTFTAAGNIPKGSFIISTTTGPAGSEYNDTTNHVTQLSAASFTANVPEPSAAFGVGALAAAALRRRRPVRC